MTNVMVENSTQFVVGISTLFVMQFHRYVSGFAGHIMAKNWPFYTVSQKRDLYTFAHNFGRCWRIFEIFPLLNSSRNLQQTDCHIADHTLNVLLHYLVKWQFQRFNVLRWKLGLVAQRLGHPSADLTIERLLVQLPVGSLSSDYLDGWLFADSLRQINHLGI